jgi:hypothetical protein
MKGRRWGGRKWGQRAVAARFRTRLGWGGAERRGASEGVVEVWLICAALHWQTETLPPNHPHPHKYLSPPDPSPIPHTLTSLSCASPTAVLVQQPIGSFSSWNAVSRAQNNSGSKVECDRSSSSVGAPVRSRSASEIWAGGGTRVVLFLLGMSGPTAPRRSSGW